MKRKIAGVIVCTLLIFAAVFSVAGIATEELTPLSFYIFGSESITWDAMLNFSEPSGKGDYVVFGEAPDANDGEPPDIYDAPKPPLPIPPYLLAWFDDGLSVPYHDLWHDYRMYPDTSKVWDLYVRWKSTDATPINIDMTWDVSEFIGIEYEYIILNRYNRSTGEWDFAADLLTENYYTYAPEYFMEQWVIDHFQINAYVNRPPYVPSSPDPVDGATDADVDADLSWTGGDPDPGNTVIYDVYFGTNIPPPQVIGNQSTTSHNPGTMNYNIQYYWKIVAWDNHGVSAEGPIWNFTTQAQPNDPPYAPSNPDPPSGETNVSIGTGLSWSGGDPDGDPVTYDGYFGTTNPPPNLFSNQSETTYEIFGTLDYETMYFWKIVAWDNHSASTEGPIWTFTTEEPFVGWECPLDFTEPDGGYDNVFFGEKIDASDGHDSYDVPKSPPGMTPYIRAWFDTAFPDPHDALWKDYKQYPDTSKVWNLSVQWVPDDYASPTDITISWNISCLNTDEYTCTKLKNTGSGEAVNMLLNERYTFNASALTPHHFQIICSNEIYIANLQSKWNLVSLPFNQSVPKENIIVCYNEVDYSWENATTGNNPTGGSLILGYIYYWDTSTPQHYDLSDVFEPGYGYWMYAFYDCELWTEDFGITINDGYITDLLTTWNLMGLPNDVPLPKEDLIVRYNEVDYSWENATTGNNPTGRSLILGYIYYWDTSTPQHYDLSDVFEPGYGYWMYAYHDCTLRREIFVPIIIDNSPDTAGTGNGFIFNASVSDSDGIDGVWVEYWYDGGTHLNDFMISTGVDDYYEKMIMIPSDSVDPLHYIISANDTYNFWSNTGEQTVTVIDDDAPECSWILKPEAGTTGESVIVNVSSTDNIGVTYYKITVDSVEYDMIKNNDDYTYVINIPENSIADIIYNCTFKDAQGNAVSTEDVTITVTDNDIPWIFDVLATPSLTIQGGFVNITCDVTDNVAVDTVMVNISGPAGFTPVNTTMYDYYNTSYSIVGTYSYFIWASDTSNNTITSLTYDFYIYDPTIFYVDDDYNSSTQGWGYDHFDIIQDGINAAIDGDIIIVNDGTYNESIEITTEITLQSNDGAETTTINSTYNGITINANNVTIRGFTVKQDVYDTDDGVVVGTGFYNIILDCCTICNYGYGIFMKIDSHHNYILNCILDSCNFGIHIMSHNSTIADNVAYNCFSDGFEFSVAHYNYISNNTAYNNNRFGFNLETGSCHNTLIGNTAYDNGGYYTFYNVQGSNYNTYIDNTAFMTNSSIPLRYGFMFGQSDYCTLASNKVYNLSRDGILLGDGSDHNNITSNTIYNTRHGIHIYLNSDNNTVFNNTVHNSTTGVFLNTNSNNNVVTLNNLLDNSYGVNLSYSAPSMNNTIYRNNIMRNTEYGVFNHDTESVNATYNYWGDESGPYHPTSNPTGQGDNVSDNVDFIPWLDAEGNPTSNPPKISNIVSNPESQVVDKFVNITCDVTDDLGVGTVKVNITGPAGFTPINETMGGGIYYYNRSYNIVGIYSFFIWANDTSCNSNTSDVYTFSIITSLLLVDSESDDNTDLISDTPTMMTIQHMDTDNNAIVPLFDSLIGWNIFDDTWEVTLEFTEPDGGYDDVFFGEKIDASDGQDIYDVPKPPSGMTPYIRAWFDTPFPEPYGEIWNECKRYPDAYKVWNLSVQWVPKGYQSPTDITISWNTVDINASEYNAVTLYDVSCGVIAAYMLVDTEYTFTAVAMCPKDFQIICSIYEPPVPDLDCDGEIRWLDIRPGDTATGEFTVENIGDPGSLLDWEITEWPEFGCWHFEPDCGDDLRPEDGPVTVHASVVAPEREGEHFFGSIEIIDKNNYCDSDTINVYLFTTSWMTIEKPTDALYINNEKIIPFIVPVIIGRINIEVNTSSIIDTVMFFVDGELQHVDATPPFDWTWDKIKFLRHALKIVIYEDNIAIDVDEIIVWKFF